MTKTNNAEKKPDETTKDGGFTERLDTVFVEPEEGPKSFRTAVQEFFERMNRPGKTVTPPDPKQDRTRALILLIGGIVGSVLLFIGVFSTPPTKPTQAQRDRMQPNLGRKETDTPARLASPTPLLSAQAQSDEPARDHLTPADIQNTSQRDPASGPLVQEGVSTKSLRGQEPALSQPLRAPVHVANQADVPLTFSYGTRKENIPPSGPDVPAPTTESFRPVLPGPSNSPPTMNSLSNGLSPKSSIVFVRSGNGSVSQTNPALPETNSLTPTLLAPGSRLIGRLESAVTSALRVPVVADIEYNYEKDGMILIPAGTKAIGELQQTSTNGYIGIVFHSLQLPDGRAEQIEATATDLVNQPLKGKVTGTNRGRKFVTRTLTGVGTIAAYVVGGGAGVGQSITGGTLLRDRLAGNISSAGEQELTNASIAQNIVVTLPAQTRIYIVFQKAAIERASNTPPASTAKSDTPAMPTAQELRELMDLRREINQMYAESGVPPSPSGP